MSIAATPEILFFKKYITKSAIYIKTLYTTDVVF